MLKTIPEVWACPNLKMHIFAEIRHRRVPTVLGLILMSNDSCLFFRHIRMKRKNKQEVEDVHSHKDKLVILQIHKARLLVSRIQEFAPAMKTELLITKEVIQRFCGRRGNYFILR